jgi:hypothetical protein
VIGRRAAVVALAISVAAGVVGSITASNRPASAQAGAPDLVLDGQSPWVPLGGTFTMQLRSETLPPGSTVALTIHDALRSRTAFDESVRGGALPPSRDRVAVPLDSLPVDPATGDRVLTLPTAGLTEGGVYPIEVDTRSAGDDSLAHFVTHVVVADLAADGSLAVGVPLNVAWVWPLRAAPAYSRAATNPNPAAGPEPDPAVVASLDPNGRLGRQAAQLAGNKDVPLTLAPSPETLDAWSTLATKNNELAAGVAALREAAKHDEVLTGPFVPLDLPAILGAGLGPAVNGELARGVGALEQFFGTHLDPSTALPGPLDPASLRLLANASVRQLVVHANALTPVDEKYTPAHPYRLEAVPGDDSTAATAITTDPGFERFLSGDDPPALRAAHLLSGLALVANEQPSVSRAVAFANPDHWDANDAFVTAMLAGLRQNPLLEPTTVSGLLDAVPTATTGNGAAATPVVRELASYSAPPPPVSLREYQQGQADQFAMAGLVGASDPRAARGDRALASVLTTAWANPKGRERARTLVQSLHTNLVVAQTQITSQIQVQPRTTITITSSKAQIPIGLKNISDHPVSVHLKLESDRLLFPDGAERDVTLPASRSTTVRIAVETRSSGRSPLLVTVTTAGGLLVTQPVRITVRSSFVSGVGVFLTVGAIVFLALWWAWDIRRRRRARGGGRTRGMGLPTPSGQPA